MRRIAANYIFPIDSEPIRNGFIELEDDGTIIKTGELTQETASTEFYNGILCPGFVNSHCHIELSSLQGKFKKGTGMSGFINQINELRESAPKEVRIECIANQFEKLYDEGVSAMADISNCDESFQIKKESPIYTRTFIEVFGTEANDVPEVISGAKQLLEKATEMGIDAGITPHSPYTMSPELLTAASAEGLSKGFISYHNQESQEEEDMICSHSGALYENYIGRGLSVPPATGKPALLHFLDRISKVHPAPFKENILLIHNTVTNQESIDAAKEAAQNLFWVTCPLSNIFIHNTLAPLKLFRENGLKILVGTDSLSSNDILSMVEEIKCIQSNFPEIPLAEILQWSTLNGAEALAQHHWLGSFTSGKKPGVVLIDNIDFENMKLTPQSRSKRII